MKILVHISRIIVGVLFIFSGFIKLNDPLGFSYKLQEYFDANVLGLEFLIPFALLIAIFLVIFEILVGVTLLLGYLKKVTLWSLMGMIVFFTFLTFYSAYFNKVTDCGCFGDAIPLTPWESFIKDVILLVFIIVLFVGKKYIQPIGAVASHKWIVFVCFTLCLGFGYYVLMHLPWLDFRPYKIGVNIEEAMQTPDGAPEAELAYHWKFRSNGEDHIITTSGSYPSFSGEFISVDTETISEGYVPPIHDFSIEKDGVDYTKQFLNEDKLLVIVMYNLLKSEKQGMKKINTLVKDAQQAGYKVIGLSASISDQIMEAKQAFKFDLDFYSVDETALKTIVRSNPGILRLQRGTIKQKLHWNDSDELNFETNGED
ncbi:BT_3928 family protein [Aquimarina intermedia]|uniref:DoxX-like protein n=1 Tax=Aquimarina intermedia TaxID=350814 RepID=A0A5S5C4K3_9FLAO|nr:BT_3928 family protein [Aquimarina intermedia]TYP73538.1 DoxX-like protein [Aquimarina intermedia]